MRRCIDAGFRPFFSCGRAEQSFALFLLLCSFAQPARCEDDPNELKQPPVCSRYGPIPKELEGKCEITSLGKGADGKERFKVKVNLTAQTAEIEVGGYKVVTENYGTYLPPIVEAEPGDTVAARLVNNLGKPIAPSPHAMDHGTEDANPTNLHYFHGGIVTPRNERSEKPETADAGWCDPKEGCGDNVYVDVANGKDEAAGQADYVVPIPSNLDARVLEKDGYIEHPRGLNWYHSHRHGISSDQVMGGLSGLLSVGDARANVRACKRDPADPTKCLPDTGNETTELKARTDVLYALLRDISLQAINNSPATWAPRDRDFPLRDCPSCPKNDCGVWREGQVDFATELRKGFCQRKQDSAWLFTLNGQRFPTIKIKGGRNLLLRLGNLSANVAYWLDLQEEKSKTTIPLTLLGVDGVVPLRPEDVSEPKLPVAALSVPDFLFMPASRAEIYIRNDCKHDDKQIYILRTKGLTAGSNQFQNDRWPEIQLARIELERSAVSCEVDVALNAPVAMVPAAFTMEGATPLAKREPPEGCVPDINPANGEHRRITFFGTSTTLDGRSFPWGVGTEIVAPPKDGNLRRSEDKFVRVEGKTVGKIGGNGDLSGIPFEDYVQDGKVDWTKRKHVCVELDRSDNSGHMQLWVLLNDTKALHNFHIHQMKFRLATKQELEAHGIEPPTPSHTCDVAPDQQCSTPDYKLYDEESISESKGEILWHDTMPIPPGQRVFLVMSFDAPEQEGRFVFHCHILKHEDAGLMAPIEVWRP